MQNINHHQPAQAAGKRNAKQFTAALLSLLITLLPAIAAKAQCNAWKLTGNNYVASNDELIFDQNAMAINPTDGTPYIVYLNGADHARVIVKKFAGGTWQNVGGDGISDSAALEPHITIDNSGTPYVSYADYTDTYGSDANMNVKKFNGVSWESVGGAGFAAYPIGYFLPTSMVLDGSGTPYVLYPDNSSGYTVRKFNGSTWETLGSAMVSYNKVVMAADATTNIYLAILEAPGSVVVKKYDGAGWVQVGTETFPCSDLKQGALHVSAAGTLRLAYADDDIDGKVTVKKFDGTNWLTEGAGGFSSAGAHQVIVTADAADMPYVMFGYNYYLLYGSGDRAVVMKYDGSSWTNMGKTGFSDGVIRYPAIAVANSGMVYASYMNDGFANESGNHIAVVNFEGMAPVTSTASGCYTTLKDPSLGGLWTSGNTAVAVVNYMGSITAIAPGTATITYTLDACTSTYVQTVNIMPGGGGISGADTVCTGIDNGILLTDTMAGDYSDYGWSSSNEAVAIVGAWSLTQDNVYGLSAGTATIMHVKGACLAAHTVTVTVADAGTITGTGSVFVGGSITLADSVSGGVWSTDPYNENATIDSLTGVLAGHNPGTIEVFYTVAYNCGTAVAAKTITVTDFVATPITGNSIVCTGATNTLGHATPGGTWSSSNTAVAIIDSASGVVTAIAAGNATITYTLPMSGMVITEVTVAALPAAGTITGASSVATSSAISLTNAVSGGMWSVSNANASISATGILTGVSAGTVIVSYSVTNSCGTSVATLAVTVNIALSPISGSLMVCSGSATALSNTTSGGTWASSNTAIATVNAAGLVSGLSAGTAAITYTVAGSSVSAVVTVVAMPAAITGAASVCVNATATLSNSVAGGTWSSGNNAIATINAATGEVSGITAGNTTITYAVGASCYRTTGITVKPLPAAISGTTTICAGANSVLTDATGVGVSWVSGNPAVATIGSGSGAVSGISAGTSVITYTINTGCSITTVVTINPLPAAITGGSSFCAGTAATLTSADAGGTWASSNSAIATISPATGALTANAAGTTYITYTLATGCKRVAPVTVNALPAAITGPSSLCAGSSATYTTATTGGVWSSSNSAIATIGTGGAVSGISAGLATISYTIASGCVRTTTVNVITGLAANTGVTLTCVGSSVTLSNTATGGTWSSGTATVAPVSSAGVVSGVAAGTTRVTYSVGGCTTFTMVTVNAAPPAITGASSICVGLSTTLANAMAGGTWSSSNAMATIGSATGIVMGAAPGTATITYEVSAGCRKTTTFGVKANPVAISGNTALCTGGTSVVTDATPTGVSWTSSDPAIATINATSGLLTGIANGNATITYLANTGCHATKGVTVDAAPSVAAITGPSAVAIGNSITLANTTPGGTWSSTSTNMTITSAGIATAVTGAAATIKYTVTNGVCQVAASKAITIVSSKNAAFAEAGNQMSFSVYPNPTTGAFTVQTTVAGTFIIYTLEGKELQSSRVAEGSNSLALPHGIAAGIYMCRYHGADGSATMVRLVYQP